MITAVDTNVLIDILANDKRYVDRSRTALRRCETEGGLVICEIVLAEIARYFKTVDDLSDVLDRLNIRSEAFGNAVCHRAGSAYLKYRERGGARTRMLADFMIGAHAQFRCTRLHTRDRGFYHDYFPELDMIDPLTESGS